MKFVAKAKQQYHVIVWDLPHWWLTTVYDIAGKSQEHRYSWRQSKPEHHASFSKPWSNQPQIPAKRKELFDKSTKDTVLETGVEKKRSFTLVLSGRTKISQIKVMQDL